MRETGSPTGRRGERGHLLVLLMVGLTVMLIMMTAAAQSVTFQMRREREKELIFRGEQYVKALDAFRKASGGAFPIGDLKVLAKKNIGGIRFIRRMYKNPMDPNGEWQYLYLHPGGTGFINPCASLQGGVMGAGNAFAVGGMQAMGGMQGVGMKGGGFRGGRSGRGGGRIDDAGLTDDERLAQGPSMGQRSALDPNTFKQLGMQKMNLPIVGVVNCQMAESIGVYRGQTYLNNWAFTPLAMGEFTASVPTAGGGAQVNLPKTGLGMSGSEVFTKRDRKVGRNADGVLQYDPPPDAWNREGSAPPPEEQTGEQQDPNRRGRRGGYTAGGQQNADDQDDEEAGEEDEADEDDEGDEDADLPEDPNQPSDPNQASDPNHPADPNHPVDPNHPADPNQPAPSPAS